MSGFPKTAPKKTNVQDTNQQNSSGFASSSSHRPPTPYSGPYSSMQTPLMQSQPYYIPQYHSDNFMGGYQNQLHGFHQNAVIQQPTCPYPPLTGNGQFLGPSFNMTGQSLHNVCQQMISAGSGPDSIHERPTPNQFAAPTVAAPPPPVPSLAVASSSVTDSNFLFKREYTCRGCYLILPDPPQGEMTKAFYKKEHLYHDEKCGQYFDSILTQRGSNAHLITDMVHDLKVIKVAIFCSICKRTIDHDDLESHFDYHELRKLGLDLTNVFAITEQELQAKKLSGVGGLGIGSSQTQLVTAGATNSGLRSQNSTTDLTRSLIAAPAVFPLVANPTESGYGTDASFGRNGVVGSRYDRRDSVIHHAGVTLVKSQQPEVVKFSDSYTSAHYLGRLSLEGSSENNKFPQSGISPPPPRASLPMPPPPPPPPSSSSSSSPTISTLCTISLEAEKEKYSESKNLSAASQQSNHRHPTKSSARMDLSEETKKLKEEPFVDFDGIQSDSIPRAHATKNATPKRDHRESELLSAPSFKKIHGLGKVSKHKVWLCECGFSGNEAEFYIHCRRHEKPKKNAVLKLDKLCPFPSCYYRAVDNNDFVGHAAGHLARLSAIRKDVGMYNHV